MVYTVYTDHVIHTDLYGILRIFGIMTPGAQHHLCWGLLATGRYIAVPLHWVIWLHQHVESVQDVIVVVSHILQSDTHFKQNIVQE